MVKVGLKMLFTGGIIFWLISSGKLQLGHVQLYIDQPLVVLYSLGIFLFGFIVAQSIRWNLLLGGLGIGLTPIKAMRLQMIGFFFNVAMPGAVGGDLVKAIYVAKEIGSKTKPMTTILLDRILGLISLFFLAGTMSIFNFSSTWEIAALRPFLVMIWGVLLGLGSFALLIHVKRNSEISSIRILQKNWFGMSVLRSIAEAFWSFRRCPGVLVKGVLLGAAIQLIYGSLFYYVTFCVNGAWPHIGTFATVFPFGVLIASIPIAPGGLGVGHAGFEKVFSLGGIENGANVFNVIILGQLLLNLSGAIPYLLYKSQGGGLPEFGDQIKSDVREKA